MHASPAAVETEQVVLTVPRAVVRSAEQIAARTHRPVETVLAEWLSLSPVEQAGVDALLEDNREGRLDDAGRGRLDAVMLEYDRRLLRKSQALREAVGRGLRGPLAA